MSSTNIRKGDCSAKVKFDGCLVVAGLVVAGTGGINKNQNYRSFSAGPLGQARRGFRQSRFP